MAETRSAQSQLAEACAAYWKATTRRQPTWATMVAIHEHDDRLEDLSPEARDAWIAELDGLVERVTAVPEAGLDDRGRVTRSLLLSELEGHRNIAALLLDDWAVDQLQGPQVSFFDLVRTHAVHDERSAGTFLARVGAMPAALAQYQANLERGLRDGRVAARCVVLRALQQLDDLIERGPERSALAGVLARRPESFDAAAWDRFGAALRSSLERGLFPALDGLRSFLREHVLPSARTAPGIQWIPGGPEAYRAFIRLHLGEDVDPSVLHATGVREVARIRSEMERLLAELLPGTELGPALRVLRADPRFAFTSAEEIVAKAESAVKRATEAAHACFSLLPSQPCVVRPVEPHAEKSSPAAFYQPPAPDGTRPGTYFINTHEPTSRPRYEAEVVAFHEAVPGHHLQVALAQEIDAPEFQKHVFSTAFVEGWALYAERLAEELHLYTGTLDRLGTASCDAWRASRLVVDTGLHALGWTREQAVEYMAANTAASLLDIEVEVDRYVTWPGQALSYKWGQLAILDLRREAEAALGPRFDLATFHRVVLENGAVTLPILRGQVRRWTAAQSRA